MSGGYRKSGGGGSDMKINRGRVREGDVPLPREARKLLGVPLLATQTIYQYFEALNWGERLKNGGKQWLGGGGGELRILDS